jgi:hypothetical protein
MDCNAGLQATLCRKMATNGGSLPLDFRYRYKVCHNASRRVCQATVMAAYSRDTILVKLL